MSRSRASRIAMLFAAAAIAGLMISGCAKKPMWGDPETGLALTYRMPANESFTYRTTNEFAQTMEVMGQSMKITGDDGLRFTIVPKATKAADLTLAVAIDSMYINVSSPQGEMKADVNGVIGKSFEMVLSPFGKELELVGVETIEYDMGPQGKRSVQSNFSAVFPDLPAGPVTVGDSWTAIDSVAEKSGDGESLIVLNNTHTLAGIETMNGMECARITSVVAGTLWGKGKQAGMEFISEATIEAEDIWYFAYKEGCFVGASSKGSATGTIKDTGGAGITIPMTREFTMTSALVAKK